MSRLKDTGTTAGRIPGPGIIGEETLLISEAARTIEGAGTVTEEGRVQIAELLRQELKQELWLRRLPLRVLELRSRKTVKVAWVDKYPK